MARPREILALAASLLAGGVALGGALGLGAALARRAAHESHQQPEPERLTEATTFTSPELVKKGRALFLDSCAHCHAADATGDEGPDLHDLQVSDRYISHMITFGEPHEMPSFAKKLRKPDITALTAYLRTLEAAP